MSDQIPLARSSTITNTVSLNSQLFSPPNTQLIFYRTNSIDTVVFSFSWFLLRSMIHQQLIPYKPITLHSCGTLVSYSYCIPIILYHTWSLHWTWQLISLCTSSVLFYWLLFSALVLNTLCTQIYHSNCCVLFQPILTINSFRKTSYQLKYIYYTPLSLLMVSIQMGKNPTY